MNSLLLKRESTPMNELNKKLFHIDVTDNVSQSKFQASKELAQLQYDDIQNVLWMAYTKKICKLEVKRYQRLHELQNDPNLSSERRYFLSTPARRVFKKLMILKRFENSPVATVDIASAIYVSHKAASDIIKDALAFDTIEESTVDGRKRYVAKDWWVESTMRNGAHWQYVNGESCARQRLLYSEFARANQQQMSDTQFNII